MHPSFLHRPLHRIKDFEVEGHEPLAAIKADIAVQDDPGGRPRPLLPPPVSPPFRCHALFGSTRFEAGMTLTGASVDRHRNGGFA